MLSKIFEKMLVDGGCGKVCVKMWIEISSKKLLFCPSVFHSVIQWVIRFLYTRI